jgi:protein-S-isoprenylcysteine O-methyltransferase Ste14
MKGPAMTKRFWRIFLGYAWLLLWIFGLFPLILVYISRALDSHFGLSPFLPRGLSLILSIPFFLTGAAGMIWSNVYLVKVGRGHPFSEPAMEVQPKTVTLITTGPYRYSRNPMILGYWFALFSLGLFLKSAAFMLFLLPVLILVSCCYILWVEEPWTEKRFGGEYERYKKATPRFIPRMKAALIPKNEGSNGGGGNHVER